MSTQPDDADAPPSNSGAWLIIKKQGRSGRAAFTLRSHAGDERLGEDRAAPPRPMPPRDAARVLGFDAWHERYSYFVQCMLAMLRHRVEGAPLVWDWEGLRSRLAWFVYNTSSSRFRTFRVQK